MNNTTKTVPANVSLILLDTIRLENVTNDLIDSLKDLGAKESTVNDGLFWIIPFGDDNDLAKKLQLLNKLGVLFAGDHLVGPRLQFSRIFAKESYYTEALRRFPGQGQANGLFAEI
jgi:hypothetical protein